MPPLQSRTKGSRSYQHQTGSSDQHSLVKRCCCSMSYFTAVSADTPAFFRGVEEADLPRVTWLETSGYPSDEAASPARIAERAHRGESEALQCTLMCSVMQVVACGSIRADEQRGMLMMRLRSAGMLPRCGEGHRCGRHHRRVRCILGALPRGAVFSSAPTQGELCGLAAS